MPAAKTTGATRLAKLLEERAALDKREAEIRQEVALELGEAVLDVGAEQVPVSELKALLKAAVAIGVSVSIEALRGLEKPRANGRSDAANAAPQHRADAV